MDGSYHWNQNWPENAIGSTFNSVGHDGNSVWMQVGSAYDRHVQSYELGHVESSGNIYMTGYPDRFDTLNCWWTSSQHGGNELLICQYDVDTD